MPIDTIRQMLNSGGCYDDKNRVKVALLVLDYMLGCGDRALDVDVKTGSETSRPVGTSNADPYNAFLSSIDD